MSLDVMVKQSDDRLDRGGMGGGDGDRCCFKSRDDAWLLRNEEEILRMNRNPTIVYISMHVLVIYMILH